jgi:hypothetical protein
MSASRRSPPAGPTRGKPAKFLPRFQRPEIRCTCRHKLAECDRPRIARRAGLVMRCPKCGRDVMP